MARSIAYTERDRDAHYLATVKAHRCVVCLMGMSASHGRSDVAHRAYGAPLAYAYETPAPFSIRRA